MEGEGERSHCVGRVFFPVSSKEDSSRRVMRKGNEEQFFPLHTFSYFGGGEGETPVTGEG